MIQDHEIDAWLGTEAGLSPEQRDEFARLVRAYDAMQAGRDGERADYADEDNAAWMAALDQATGTLDIEARGRAYRAAQDEAYAGAVIAVLAGVPEAEAARQATLPRGTLRKALGKDRAPTREEILESQQAMTDASLAAIPELHRQQKQTGGQR